MATPHTTVRPDPAAGRVRPRGEFRPEIEALRAVAVSAVVLYHLWPKTFRGGFVGVDVFFVISGFLISRHLVSEASRTGRVSLRVFWARRIRRLLPAAVLVLLFCLTVLLLVMPTVTWTGNFEEIRASALYVENWLLGFHAVDYLAAEANPSLVQHYWSLAVEEQFYLAWPILVLAAAIVAARLRTHVMRVFGVVLVLVLIGGLALSVVYTRVNPQMSFFATPTRAWEFAAGGLVVITGEWISHIPPRWGAAVSWAGLAVIVACCRGIDGTRTAFPGWIAVIPVAGAALVIAAGAPVTRFSTRRLMSARPLQWLGACSYSVYLWHWPLIIAAPWLLRHGLTFWDRLAIGAVTIAIAWASKRWVEDPLRTGPVLNRRTWVAYGFAALAMCVLALSTTAVDHHRLQKNRVGLTAEMQAIATDPCHGAAAVIKPGCASPFAWPPGLDPAVAAADISTINTCQQNVAAVKAEFCTLGVQKNPAATIAVVGNSHALRLVPALEQYGLQRHWKIILAAHTDCLGLTTAPVVPGHPADTCERWSQDVQSNLLALRDLSGVIFASHKDAQTYLAGVSADQAAIAAADRQVIASWMRFHLKGVPIVVTGDVPGTRPDDAPTCVAMADADDPCAMPRSSAPLHNMESSLAAANPDLVTVLPLDKYFCDAHLCHALIGGLIVYSDSHHLTTAYSRSMGEFLGADVAAAFGLDDK